MATYRRYALDRERHCYQAVIQSDTLLPPLPAWVRHPRDGMRMVVSLWVEGMRVSVKRTRAHAETQPAVTLADALARLGCRNDRGAR